MDIFDFEDYREFLKAYISNEAQSWGVKSSMAQAAGCQRSFFSQVLNGHADLSLEHGSNIAHFLKFDGDQSEQLLDLISLSKTQNSYLQKILSERIEKRKHERENLSRKFGVPSISNSEYQQLYYSVWYWPVIHILTGIDSYQTSESIAEKLSLPLDVVNNTLNELLRMELIQLENGKWKNIKGLIHLPKESAMIVGHHYNWRQQANLDLQTRSLDSVHYTSLQSISKRDMPKFKKLVTELIESSRDLVIQSGKEEVVCFACDLFIVGK